MLGPQIGYLSLGYGQFHGFLVGPVGLRILDQVLLDRVILILVTVVKCAKKRIIRLVVIYAAPTSTIPEPTITEGPRTEA